MQDNLLYYLNNHRGGFFRLFNGGTVFGDAATPQYNPNVQNNYLYQQQQSYQQQQQQQQQYKPQQNQQQLGSTDNLAFLQGLAEAVNQGGGINLSNLGANGGLLGSLANAVGTMTGQNAVGSQNDGQTFSVGEIVSNLLTGFVGNRFSSRKKRSIDREEHSTVSTMEENVGEVQESNENSETAEEDEPEGRIINSKLKQISSDIVDITFPKDDNRDGKLYTYSPEEFSSSKKRGNKKVKFTEDNYHNSADPSDKFVFYTNHVGKQIKFTDTEIQPMESNNFLFSSNLNQVHEINQKFKFPDPVDGIRSGKGIVFEKTTNNLKLIEKPERIKMVFPDRTGTGNLKFDTDEFNRKSGTDEIRFGRILNNAKVQQSNQAANQVSFDNNNNYSSDNYNLQNTHGSLSSSSTTNDNHRFGNQNYNINYNSQSSNSNNNYKQQPSYSSGGGTSSQNIYVTNAQGVVEYYINEHGNKVYT